MILVFSKCFHNVFFFLFLFFSPITNNYHAQSVEIWRHNAECDDLISMCNVWCHTSDADVKAAIVETVNKLSLSLVLLNIYQSVVT